MMLYLLNIIFINLNIEYYEKNLFYLIIIISIKLYV